MTVHELLEVSTPDQARDLMYANYLLNMANATGNKESHKEGIAMLAKLPGVVGETKNAIFYRRYRYVMVWQDHGSTANIPCNSFEQARRIVSAQRFKQGLDIA